MGPIAVGRPIDCFGVYAVVFKVEPESTAVALGHDVVLGCWAEVLDVGGRVLRSASINYTWTLDGHLPPASAAAGQRAAVPQSLAVRADRDHSRHRSLSVPRPVQLVRAHQPQRHRPHRL